MSIKRREFIASVGAVGLSGAALPVRLHAETGDGSSGGAATLAHYEGRRKDWFYLYNADATHQGRLRLVKILDRSNGPDTLQFNLHFRAISGAEILPEGLYHVAGEEPLCFYLRYSHEHKGKHRYNAEFALLS